MGESLCSCRSLKLQVTTLAVIVATKNERKLLIHVVALCKSLDLFWNGGVCQPSGLSEAEGCVTSMMIERVLLFILLDSVCEPFNCLTRLESGLPDPASTTACLPAEIELRQT